MRRIALLLPLMIATAACHDDDDQQTGPISLDIIITNVPTITDSVGEFFIINSSERDVLVSACVGRFERLTDQGWVDAGGGPACSLTSYVTLHPTDGVQLRTFIRTEARTVGHYRFAIPAAGRGGGTAANPLSDPTTFLSDEFDITPTR